jgi:hypothetical protein|tara:strand:+ start:287 stop:571 length:285 start_codon:yes stop_codon:yes gene_type:complete
MEMIIGIIIGIVIGFITSRVIAYKNVKSISQEFRTVAKRREYKENTYKKRRPTHNKVGEQFTSEEQPKKKRKKTGKKKYYKRKNTSKNKKVVQS